ncbi:MAG: hypothetical protein LC128_07165 [Chitinophagales bacterium]|nr:hypothetical protein [Chitinophagales bacterium]
MKKLLIVLMVAGAFAACNSKGSGETPATDSTPAVQAPAPTTDSASAAKPATDSAAKPAATDSTKK